MHFKTLHDGPPPLLASPVFATKISYPPETRTQTDASPSMYEDSYQSEYWPDPLDEFLSQILFDAPNANAVPSPTYSSGSTPALTASSASPPHFTCHWISRDHPPLVCGASLSTDPQVACEHFRQVHNVRGNDKVVVNCLWYGCRARPMQMGSVIRHILTVHLGLLRWRCEMCGRVFSRRGTGHVCNGPPGA